MTHIQNVRQAVRDKYAWPGGYPLCLFLADGGTLCIGCARREWRRVAGATRHPGEDEQWEVIQPAINWEDKELQCDHCYERIESAYGGEE